MSLATGTKLGPYEILSAIGAGGMGEVYKARDTRLGREVAVKVLPAEFASDPERLRRFEQEARAAAALNHPNILVVFDIGTHEGTPYIVDQLLEGETLRERLRGGPIAPAKAVDFGVQIVAGTLCRSREGHRPSGSEAGEPLRHERRPRQDSRLWPGTAEASRATGSGAPDRGPDRR